jgi:peroxiredoxin
MAGMKEAQLVAYVVVGGIVLGLLGYFSCQVPEMTRRDKQSACVAMGPDAFNAKLGKLPQVAPDFSAQGHDGQSYSLSQYRGKVVFLNFWADWCPPCIDELPSMNSVAAQLTGDDFVLLAVGSGTTWKGMTNKLRELLPGGTKMTLLLDTSSPESEVGDLPKSYGTERFPETFLIDKQGRVRYYFVNKRNWEQGKAFQCLRSLIEE